MKERGDTERETASWTPLCHRSRGSCTLPWRDGPAATHAPRSKLTADPGPPRCSSSCSRNVRSAFAAASVLKVIRTKTAGAALWYESLHTYCQSHRSSQTGSFQNGCCNTPPLFGCFTALPQLRSAHLPLGGERDGLSFGPCHPWTHSLFNSPLEKVEGPLS